MRLANRTTSFQRRTGHGFFARTKQRGAILIVALMLLVVMTVLAVSGIGNSVLEQRMSGNYYHSATAFEAAEYALRVAEKWLTGQVTSASPWETWFTTNTSMNGLYTTQSAVSPNSVEVCRGDIDCGFDPRVESNWCNGGAGCDLPKGFVTLGDTLEGTPLDTLDLAVAHQPQFIIEYIGLVESTRDIRLGIPPPSTSKRGFRITAIGWGQEAVTRHVLQSHVILPL